MKAKDRNNKQPSQPLPVVKPNNDGRASNSEPLLADSLATKSDNVAESLTLPSVSSSGDYSAIVLAATQGSIEAFEYLYNQHAEQIYRYVYYRVSNQDDAEDLVAQVFVQAWSNITNYKSNGSPFVAWLYTIAHNLVVNYYKKSERQAKMQMPLEDWVADVQGTHDPEREFSNKLRNEALRRAILQLGSEQQQVIYFRYVEDWSHQQIASLMGKTEAAVRVIQFRAQKVLRQLLEKDGWAEVTN